VTFILPQAAGEASSVRSARHWHRSWAGSMMCSMGKNMNVFLSKKAMMFLELGNFHGHPNIEYRVYGTVYIYTYVYIHYIYTHIYIYTYIYTRIYTYTHTYIYIFIFVPIIFPSYSQHISNGHPIWTTSQGEEGILTVRESLCNVDAETASAWCLEAPAADGPWVAGR
jgi:hypothetical protein